MQMRLAHWTQALAETSCPSKIYAAKVQEFYSHGSWERMTWFVSMFSASYYLAPHVLSNGDDVGVCPGTGRKEVPICIHYFRIPG